MKKFLVIVTVLVSITFVSCQRDECDPGNIVAADEVNLVIKNSNGTAYIKYSNNQLPDSVKVTNLTTGMVVTNRFLLEDSILLFSGYNTTNNAVTKYKIQKGTVAKADTLELTVSNQILKDGCGNEYPVARFGSLKMNNTSLCAPCAASTSQYYTRP